MKKIVCFMLCLLFVCAFSSCNDKKAEKDVTDVTFSQTDAEEPKKDTNNNTQNDSTDAENKEKNGDDDEQNVVTVSLYFPDNEAMNLHEEKRNVVLSGNSSLEYEILKCLFDGPESEDLSPSLDGENLINSVTVFDTGLCIVDFKSDFVILNTGGSAREMFVIDSIVNSLCALDDISEVKINIDGNDKADFGGHFMLDEPFKENTFKTFVS